MYTELNERVLIEFYDLTNENVNECQHPAKANKV